MSLLRGHTHSGEGGSGTQPASESSLAQLGDPWDSGFA